MSVSERERGERERERERGRERERDGGREGGREGERERERERDFSVNKSFYSKQNNPEAMGVCSN